MTGSCAADLPVSERLLRRPASRTLRSRLSSGDIPAPVRGTVVSVAPAALAQPATASPGSDPAAPRAAARSSSWRSPCSTTRTEASSRAWRARPRSRGAAPRYASRRLARPQALGAVDDLVTRTDKEKRPAGAGRSSAEAERRARSEVGAQSGLGARRAIGAFVPARIGAFVPARIGALRAQHASEPWFRHASASLRPARSGAFVPARSAALRRRRGARRLRPGARERGLRSGARAGPSFRRGARPSSGPQRSARSTPWCSRDGARESRVAAEGLDADLRQVLARGFLDLGLLSVRQLDFHFVTHVVFFLLCPVQRQDRGQACRRA